MSIYYQFTAELLGFEQPIPPFANATSNDFSRGVNYASGGSGILYETGRDDFVNSHSLELLIVPL